MTTRISLIAAAILTVASVNVSAADTLLRGALNASAHAALRAEHPRHVRQSFSDSATRTLANGDKVTRETVQTVTDNGFNRTTTMTNAAGQTAGKNLSVVNDPATGTHSRTMNGTTFSGKTYSHESVVVADKDTGTVTKTVTNTNVNGQTSQHSASHQISGSGQASVEGSAQ
jgi:hypothetical protein